METVVFVLMILVCFNFMLKQTYRKLRSVLVISVICALFVGLMWPYAIEQSKTQIADWLANPALMLDTSVVLSVEVVLQMAFCMLAAHIQSAGASAGMAFPRQCPDCYFGNYRYCQRPDGSERNRRGRLGSVGRLDNPACCRCIGRNDFKKSEIEKTN